MNRPRRLGVGSPPWRPSESPVRVARDARPSRPGLPPVRAPAQLGVRVIAGAARPAGASPPTPGALDTQATLYIYNSVLYILYIYADRNRAGGLLGRPLLRSLERRVRGPGRVEAVHKYYYYYYYYYYYNNNNNYNY